MRLSLLATLPLAALCPRGWGEPAQAQPVPPADDQPPDAADLILVLPDIEEIVAAIAAPESPNSTDFSPARSPESTPDSILPEVPSAPEPTDSAPHTLHESDQLQSSHIKFQQASAAALGQPQDFSVGIGGLGSWPVAAPESSVPEPSSPQPESSSSTHNPLTGVHDHASLQSQEGAPTPDIPAVSPMQDEAASDRSAVQTNTLDAWSEVQGAISETGTEETVPEKTVPEEIEGAIAWGQSIPPEPADSVSPLNHGTAEIAADNPPKPSNNDTLKADSAQESLDWAVTAYLGQYTSGNFGEALLLSPGGFEDSSVAGVSLARTLAGDRTLNLEAEGQLLKHFGDQDHVEGTLALILRWQKFPWDNVVDTSFAVGEGISYATRVPVLEATRNPKASQLLNYLLFEFTFARPEQPDWQLVTRLHHRSGVFGLFNGVSEGSNVYTAGIRHRF